MEDRLRLGFKPSDDPLALADVTLYLPTRRACRLARETFLTVTGGDAAILPRIVPIGDPDDDDIAFAEIANGGEALALPDALGGFERQVLLTELILKWARRIAPDDAHQAPLVAGTPTSAFALAADLARLMDDMTTRKVSWERLDGLVPEEVDRYWQLTLDFLRIARQLWPAVLEEHGKLEPAERRDLLIEAERRRLTNAAGPVIAAGSTGSMPTTAALLETIANLPHGAVVLPGLDTDLDEPSWRLIGGGGADEPASGHPQFAMQALLARLGISRESVSVLSAPSAHGRERLLSEALRPAQATEQWRARLSDPAFEHHADTALMTVSVIEAASAEEEALSIAVALREAYETPGKTSALVTPDRALARRVIAALERWRVPVDDSGGQSLADTPEGVFARLVAETAIGGWEPVTLLALLKHELGRFDPETTAALELAVLRGPRPRPGATGLADTLATFRRTRGQLHGGDPRRRIDDDRLSHAEALIAVLSDALAPLATIKTPLAFGALAERHRAAITALGGLSDDLAAAFDDIEKAERLVIPPADYLSLFQAAISDRVVRRPEQDVRVRIFGPLEARLQSVDRMVLGGLVEGVWPPEPRSDPWLSRPMRHELGLDLPERRIGLSAHDFAQALGHPELILSRAARLAGAPTVASRFVQRLAAVAGPERWTKAVARGSRYGRLAAQLDDPGEPARPIKRPEPKPPVEARPRRLSVTQIEDWLRDPYTIYARHVLDLQPLDDVDTPPGASDRGTLIHESIGDFLRAYPDELPADPVRALLDMAAAHFEPLKDYPEARAFWWPRLERIAQWFAPFERERRRALAKLYVETGGAIAIPFGDGEFTLSARADRIEALADGRYAILDYKTGLVPSEKQVRTGLSPQLTLEAAILRRGGFKEIPAGASVAALTYVRLAGGDPAGEIKNIIFPDGTSPDDQADRALESLTKLAAAFAKPATPYASLVHPMWSRQYGTYDHLARVKEWSLTGGASDGGGDE